MSFSGGTASSELGEASREPWVPSRCRLYFPSRYTADIPVSRGYHTYGTRRYLCA